MESEDKKLFDSLLVLLKEMEDSGDIVICSSDPEYAAKKIKDLVLMITPNTSLTTEEMYGVRSLLLKAVEDKDFFDWEMPTLTGFDAEQFKSIADKLPRE